MFRSYSAVNLHAVFATKDRNPYLRDRNLRIEMHAYIAGVSKTLGCPTLIVGGVEDHVHVLAGQGKEVSQSDWINEIKRVSSLWAKRRDEAWSEFAWQRGYGIFSVSPDAVSSLRRYIETQEEHHRTQSFEDEFVRLLEQHGMAWDARDSLNE